MRIEKAAGLPVKELVDATRPAGEWNHLYLRVTPGSSEVCLNGVSYYKFVIGSDDWNKRVAKSKFSKFEQFGKAGNGHLCFQDHGDEVAFRSIKVRRLPDGKLPQEPADGVLGIEAVPAFPGLVWDGWSPVSDDGKPVPPLRPLTVTHANDGSGRRFIVEQTGRIYMIEKIARKQKSFWISVILLVRGKKRMKKAFLGLPFIHVLQRQVNFLSATARWTNHSQNEFHDFVCLLRTLIRLMRTVRRLCFSLTSHSQIITVVR